MTRSVAVVVAMLLAGCGPLGSAAGSPTPSPIDTYTAWSNQFGDVIYIEVTSEATLKSLEAAQSSRGLSVQVVPLLPAGSAISCHKTSGGSKLTIWDDGRPGSRTLAQELCNRLP